MNIEELRYKEEVLRECFKEKLEQLNVDGKNDMCTVKCVKTYGALWHYTHQLLLAEEHLDKQTTSTETMEIKATGLKMAKEKA